MTHPALLRVAYAGAPGSFAEDAVLAAYPGAEAEPVPMFGDVVTGASYLALIIAAVAIGLGILPAIFLRERFKEAAAAEAADRALGEDADLS